MAVVIAVDAGTTGVRSIAFDASGAMLDSAYRELTQHYPRPGWVEHDPTEIAEAVRATLAEVCGRLDSPVAAIGVTDQRETVVAWDRRTGLPRHRALVWQDRRTADRCTELIEAGATGMIRRHTGLVPDPYFSATKIEWLLRHGGVTADADLAVGTVDSWVVWTLTGGAAFVTDTSNAARTMLFDIGNLRWSPELCEMFGVPAGALPEVRPSSGRVGVTVEGSGAPAGIPVSGIAGDQQAALFGQACFRPGMAKNTYGTGSFVLVNLGDRLPEPVDGLLTTVAWTIPEGTSYALEGSVFVTGAAVSWLRDGLGVISEPAETGPLAASVPDTGGVVFVPAFTGLGSPWWDPYARGLIIGLTRGTTGAHLARAAVEAMAYQTRDVVDRMRSAGTEVRTLRVDGGASAMDLLLSEQADQLGVPVERAAVAETTALGAAFLAGLAEGVWSSTDEIAGLWRSAGTFSPTGAPDVDARYRRWLEAVERSRGWARD